MVLLQASGWLQHSTTPVPVPAFSYYEGRCASLRLAGLDFGSALQILVVASQLALFLLSESHELCRRMAVEKIFFLFVSCGQVLAIGNA
jgi:hypothetical protein